MMNIIWTLPLIFSLMSLLLLSHHQICARQLHNSLRWTSAGYLAGHHLHNSKMENPVTKQQAEIKECETLLNGEKEKRINIRTKAKKLAKDDEADTILDTKKVSELQTEMMQVMQRTTLSWEKPLGLLKGLAEEKVKVLEMIPWWKTALDLRKEIMEIENQKTWETVQKKVERIQKKAVDLTADEKQEVQEILDRVSKLKNYDEGELRDIRNEVTSLWVKKVKKQVRDAKRICRMFLDAFTLGGHEKKVENLLRESENPSTFENLLKGGFESVQKLVGELKTLVDMAPTDLHGNDKKMIQEDQAVVEELSEDVKSMRDFMERLKV